MTAEDDPNAADELETLTHSASGGEYNGADSDLRVTVRDDAPESVSVSFGSDSHTVPEGATTTVTVTLSADPERTVTVPIAETGLGGATSADYSGVPADLKFDAGETQKSFVFTANPDDIDDDGESVELTFGPLPTHVTRGGTATTTVSITDDDDPNVTVSFRRSSYTVDEGGTTTIEIVLSADPERSVTIPVVGAGRTGRHPLTSVSLLQA